MPLLRRMREALCPLVLALASRAVMLGLPLLRLRHADRSGRDLSCHRRLGGRHQTAGRAAVLFMVGWRMSPSLMLVVHAALLLRWRSGWSIGPC